MDNRAKDGHNSKKGRSFTAIAAPHSLPNIAIVVLLPLIKNDNGR